MLSLLTRKLFMGSKIESRCLKVYEIPFKGGKQKSSLKSIRTWIKYDQNYIKSNCFVPLHIFCISGLNTAYPTVWPALSCPPCFTIPQCYLPSVLCVILFHFLRQKEKERRGGECHHHIKRDFVSIQICSGKKLSSSDTLLYSATHIPSISSHNIS